ncbi:MBL fold metallo-hydrolase [Aurantimonas marina]|uniref:MBL fold metallo-hydrolase n=1 Tax=Aurantimonas marina TaxID=2780508 RepID=UPI0019D26513|nr:MBL fold metallo-hydrolase [Aurantimonas marina]
MHRVFAFALLAALLILAPREAAAQSVPSTCIAVAENLPQTLRATYVSLDAKTPIRVAQRGRDEVRITYVHHSTYLIESPNGVTAATDYSGFSGPTVPDIATMNRAHTTHFTEFPDPAIDHVLKGWNPQGGPARHALTVDDMYVRNVPTDIRSVGRGLEPDGNSIFIFEVAGLCIGHLGHLHHRLTDEDYAAIGRLDILMVPVDGGYTLSQEGMGEIAKRLRSSIVLPMHRFRGPIDRFLDRLPDFAVDRRAENSFTVSLRTLPGRPTVIVLSGV